MNAILPELPKQHKKREADFGILLRKWLKTHKGKSAPFELKQTQTNSLPFKALKPEQRAWLVKAKSDEGILIRNMGGRGEPDYSFYRLSPAWVVVRYPKEFHVIDISIFLHEEGLGRASLAVERAQILSAYSAKIKS